MPSWVTIPLAPFTLTWTITDGAHAYPGPGPVGRVVFSTTKDSAWPRIDVDELSSSWNPWLAMPRINLHVEGSAHRDNLVVDLDEGSFDFSAVTFGPMWAGLDTLVLKGWSGNARVHGSAGNDIIDLYPSSDGCNDVVHGGGGTDTLDASYIESTKGVHTDGATTITNGADMTTTFSGIERLDLWLSNHADHALGTAGADVFWGLGGNDVLDGRAGADTMRGGQGDDTYHVDNKDDRVEEYESDLSGWAPDYGRDTVRSTVSFDLKDAEVETLILTGSAHAAATGNDYDQRLVGNAGKNWMEGKRGADTIEVAGDAQRDTIVFKAAYESRRGTADTVRGFDAAGEDKLDFDVAVTHKGAFTHVWTSGGATIEQKIGSYFDAGGAVESVAWSPLQFAQPGQPAPERLAYLVVDANNDGDFVEHQDYFITLRGHVGSLDSTDFI